MAVAATLAIMVLSGTARGETGRVWMYFMPFFLLSIGGVFTAGNERWERPFWGIQIGWLLVIAAVIPAVGTGIVSPPKYADVSPAALDEAAFVPVGAVFGDGLKLTGYQALYSSTNKTITLDLSWQVQKPVDTSYLFAALSVDPAGTVRTAQNWLPLDYQYPTTCWRSEEGTIHDQVKIELGKSAALGEWWLSFSGFALDEEESPIYLPVTLPDGQIDESQIGLGPIMVTP